MPDLPPAYRSARLRAFPSAVSLLAALLLAGCAGISAPLQDHSGTPTASTRTTSPMNWAALQRDLEKALQGVPDNRIEHLPEGLRVSLPAADGFATSRTDIQPTLAELLQRVVPVFSRYPHARIRIVAHTDGAGGEMHNLNLTIQRAETVMEHLRSQGIALARMSAEGRGETEPIANNKTPAGRARNRRVEFFLSPG